MSLFWMIIIAYMMGGVVTLPHRTKLAYHNSAPVREGRYISKEDVRTEDDRRYDGMFYGWWTTIWWPVYYFVIYSTRVSNFVAFPELRGPDRRERKAKADAARQASAEARLASVLRAQADAQDLQRQLRALKRNSREEWDNEFRALQGEPAPGVGYSDNPRWEEPTTSPSRKVKY